MTEAAKQTEELAPVRDFWNGYVCGTQHTTDPKFTPEYFDSIERHRYQLEPYIHSFAQFTRWRGKKVLEVGVGAGTDFLQWVRAGARAHGIDLTPEGVEHARRRLALNGLEPEDLRVGNAEDLPYPDDYFDLVYSWGVIHHSNSIENALAEIVRVTRPGGTVKLMLYNRRSLNVVYLWLLYGVLRGRPWRTPSYCLSHFVESPGTKAVTRREVRRMLAAHGVTEARIEPVITDQDRMGYFPAAVRWTGALASRVLGHRAGFYMQIEFVKPGRKGASGRAA